jgi:hypothetical protein
VAILIIAFFVLAIALEATGHVVFRGRLILGRGGRWLSRWCSLGVRAGGAEPACHACGLLAGAGGRHDSVPFHGTESQCSN